jgi:hypothetical protein
MGSTLTEQHQKNKDTGGGAAYVRSRGPLYSTEQATASWTEFDGGVVQLCWTRRTRRKVVPGPWYRKLSLFPTFLIPTPRPAAKTGRRHRSPEESRPSKGAVLWRRAGGGYGCPFRALL